MRGYLSRTRGLHSVGRGGLKTGTLTSPLVRENTDPFRTKTFTSHPMVPSDAPGTENVNPDQLALAGQAPDGFPLESVNQPGFLPLFSGC